MVSVLPTISFSKRGLYCSTQGWFRIGFLELLEVGAGVAEDTDALAAAASPTSEDVSIVELILTTTHKLCKIQAPIAIQVSYSSVLQHWS